MSIWLSLMAPLPTVVALAIAITICFVLLGAALHKHNSGIHFEAQLAEYRLLPGWAVRPVAKLLVAIEFALAGSLIVPATWPWSGRFAALLLLVYLGAIGVNLLRGRRSIDCGCGDAPQSLSWWLVARNSILVLGALLISQAGTAMTILTLLSALIASAPLILLYLAAEQILRNDAAIRGYQRITEKHS